MMKTWSVVLPLTAEFFLSACVSAAREPERSVATPNDTESVAAKEDHGTTPLDWVEGVAAGKRRAQAEKRPMVVRAGAPWCTWCNRLKAEMELPAARSALERFVLVDINVDADPPEAKGLSIGSIPALRLLNMRGQVMASREGFLSAEQLATWLDEHYDEAAAPAADILTGSQALDENAVSRLIIECAQADPVKREAALRRLLANPAAAATQAVAALREGKLAQKLAAIELLRTWKAPLAELDPWRPETLLPDRLTALEIWARDRIDEPAESIRELSANETEQADRDINHLLSVDDAEAEAIRERLSRDGLALLPLVAARLQTVTSDRDRERLNALHYRLVASEGLVLSWVGGLERLASVKSKTRHDAAAELAARATHADEPLLLELFKDPDPLVREISLRGLQTAGGAKSSGSLATLLKDPEPNVRAAVLKQIGEQPAAGLVSTIIAYVEQEQDPDLVIHAIRVLKASNSASASECLRNLLKHDSWQVRAEAAEAVGETVHKSYGDNSRQADAYVALIEMLDDADPFVISRALTGLKNSDLAAAVEPLAKIVDKHPDLAVAAVQALVQGTTMRHKALPQLRKYATHENPAVRAAAIPGLVTAEVDPADNYILNALDDPASIVRQAAARSLLGMFNAARMQHTQRQIATPASSGGLFGAIRSFFGGTAKTTTDLPTDDFDAWLVGYRLGKDRPEWMAAAIEPLVRMVASQDRQERLLAALALVSLGRDEESLPVLRQLAASAPEMPGTVGAALTWLPHGKRREFFAFLVGLEPKAGEMAEIGAGIAAAKDPRDAELLWGLLAAPDMGVGTAPAIQRSLWELYGVDMLMNRGGNVPVAPPANLVAELQRFAGSGTPWQRTVALTILLAMDANAAGDAAESILSNPETPAEFQQDALQILLLARPKEQAEELAVRQLSVGKPPLSKLTLGFLCRGPETLHQLRGDSIYLQSAQNYITRYSGEPEPVAAPRGLTAEMIRPMLNDPDPDVAAAAGYLLATLGEGDGVKKLIEHWRRDKSKSWTVPVYRAIAALDDDQQSQVLSDIYAGLESYEVRPFYWTIRSMHGPEVLKLRKRMRDEVGMDSLR